MSRKTTFTVGLLLCGLLIGLYIFQLNSLTALAYHVAETEQRFTQLKHTNTALEGHASQAVSFKDLERLAKLRNFERANSVTYLRILSGGVAQNQ